MLRTPSAQQESTPPRLTGPPVLQGLFLLRTRGADNLRPYADSSELSYSYCVRAPLPSITQLPINNLLIPPLKKSVGKSYSQETFQHFFLGGGGLLSYADSSEGPTILGTWVLQTRQGKLHLSLRGRYAPPPLSRKALHQG